jgi:hypothetical protein
MTERDYAAMSKQLRVLGDEKEYEAFLREQSLAEDHSFLLAAIKRSNLRPAVRNVVEELIKFGKIKRARHRPPRKLDDTHMIGLRRALCVLDLEKEGWGGKSYGGEEKRKSSIEEASKQLRCSYHTVEKDFYKYEPVIKRLDPQHLSALRDILSSVFK